MYTYMYTLYVHMHVHVCRHSGSVIGTALRELGEPNMYRGECAKLIRVI